MIQQLITKKRLIVQDVVGSNPVTHPPSMIKSLVNTPDFLRFIGKSDFRVWHKYQDLITCHLIQAHQAKGGEGQP